LKAKKAGQVYYQLAHREKNDRTKT
jgi:hypothetical protein